MWKLNILEESESSGLNEVFERFLQVMKEVIDERLAIAGWINLVFLKDSKIRELNRDYRNKDKATDVLSFRYLESAGDVINEDFDVIGEIFISLDTARRQADEKGHDLNKEIQILFVHGLLHILGFDHETDQEEEEMEGWAKMII